MSETTSSGLWWTKSKCLSVIFCNDRSASEKKSTSRFERAVDQVWTCERLPWKTEVPIQAVDLDTQTKTEKKCWCEGKSEVSEWDGETWRGRARNMERIGQEKLERKRVKIIWNKKSLYSRSPHNIHVQCCADQCTLPSSFPQKSHRALMTAAVAKWITPFSGPIWKKIRSLKHVQRSLEKCSKEKCKTKKNTWKTLASWFHKEPARSVIHLAKSVKHMAGWTIHMVRSVVDLDLSHTWLNGSYSCVCLSVFQFLPSVVDYDWSAHASSRQNCWRSPRVVARPQTAPSLAWRWQLEKISTWTQNAANIYCCERTLIPKTIGNRKKRLCVRWLGVINLTWENLQIAKHKSVR